jgi:FixJ family two-component response regulator
MEEKGAGIGPAKKQNSGFLGPKALKKGVSRLDARAPRRVAIIDNAEPHIDTLVAALDRAGYTCQRYTRPREFLATLRTHNCDVIVTDIVTPGMNGMEFLSSIKWIRPELPIVVVSAQGNTSSAVQAMKMGVSDFIESGTIQQPDIAERIARAFEQAEVMEEKMPAELTSMEKVTLKHILLGMGNREIAQRLGLSVRTVEDHRRNMMRKLGVANIVGLVRRCIELGVLSVAANPPLSPSEQRPANPD